ncbi:MAG: hypothetical protein WCS31_11340 [Verrucomicrobiae bacterium]
MRTSPSKRKAHPSGEDLWSWAERSKTPILREDPPVPATRTPWYRGVLSKISSRKR